MGDDLVALPPPTGMDLLLKQHTTNGKTNLNVYRMYLQIHIAVSF